jgi:hypothetical protein
METALAPNVSLRGQVGRFVLHYFEMCIPMCIGFAVGDLVYFWAAELLGYSEPFAELPTLSVLVVTLSMTGPMTAWMLQLFRLIEELVPDGELRRLGPPTGTRPAPFGARPSRASRSRVGAQTEVPRSCGRVAARTRVFARREQNTMTRRGDLRPTSPERTILSELFDIVFKWIRPRDGTKFQAKSSARLPRRRRGSSRLLRSCGRAHVMWVTSCCVTCPRFESGRRVQGNPRKPRGFLFSMRGRETPMGNV